MPAAPVDRGIYTYAYWPLTLELLVDPPSLVDEWGILCVDHGQA